MSEKYANIMRADTFQINEHAEDISVPSFPESIWIYLDTYKTGSCFSSEKHWHHSVQFNVVLEGELKAMVNGTELAVHEGQGIFVNANVLHRLWSDGRTGGMGYSFQVPLSAICSEKDVRLWGKYITPLTESREWSYILFDREEKWQREVLYQLEDAFCCANARPPVYELKIKMMLANVWALLLENIDLLPEDDPPSKKSVSAERMKEMLVFIEENYGEKITLEDIADSAHVSVSECGRCFQKVLNMTPIDYVTQIRIINACNLLRTSDVKASVVGEKVGFSEYSYFYRVFKKYMGCTPKEYRYSKAEKIVHAVGDLVK